MLSHETEPNANTSDSYAVSRSRAWFAFFMIFMLMLSDYVDRQIIVSLFPHLKEEWGADSNPKCNTRGFNE